MTNIRPATPDDAQEISNLIKEASLQEWPESVEATMAQNTPEKLIKTLSQHSTCYVHITADKITGYLDFKGSYLHSLFVHPKHMNQGIGKKLMVFWHDWATKHYVVWLFLNSSPNAVPFYLKHTFISCGQTTDSRNLTCTKMQKFLI